MAGVTDVDAFLAELESKGPAIHAIVTAALELVRDRAPALTETIKYGGIMFSSDKECGGIFPSKNHVSFEFSRGYLMRDDRGVLLGTGKFRRHLKFHGVADIEALGTEDFVHQMTMTTGE